MPLAQNSRPAAGRLRLTFYGDDFTGSTDAMEALAVNGVPTVLFLRVPDEAMRARFAEVEAIGLAGMSRAQSPEWMTEELPKAFAALRGFGAPLCHYKVCSTFDSSPEVGSIGRAIELGRAAFAEGSAKTALVVGAPVLGRYVVFGNLFAKADGETYRIDRHPTMSRHPVTPMGEADLRRHLAQQTALPVGLVDLHALRGGEGLARFGAASEPIVLVDSFDEETMLAAGEILWAQGRPAGSFVAGSSGVEYALLAWWRQQGRLPAKPVLEEAGPVAPLLVVSGSCSPGTERQIRWALANGFVGVALEWPEEESESNRQLAMEKAAGAASAALAAGESVVVYSALGPSSVRTGSVQAGSVQAGSVQAGSVQAGSAVGGEGGRRRGQWIGEALGGVAAQLVARHRPRRLLVAGGDTSGHVCQALGLQALTVVQPFAPGSPLCRAHSSREESDGLQVLLKGGQVGGERLFGEVRQGRRGS